MQTIWVVEDDENIRGMLLYAFHSAGYEAEGFATPVAFWERLTEARPTMVLLDIMLPTEDGLSILRKLRNDGRWSNLPVIMLTAKGTEYDRIKGLDIGADDYITKPFSVLEVISRVKAVLRRCDPTPTDQWQWEEIQLFLHQRQVIVNGEAVQLTFKEFELLQYLMKNADLVLSRDQLLETVWGYEYAGESRTVDMHIRTLRQKLGDAGRHIKTIRNVGYKLGG